MFHTLRRWLAAGSAVAVALVGLVAAPAPLAVADMADVATNSAANYVATHLPSKSQTSSNIDSALGLAGTGQCTYAAPLRTLVSHLEGQAQSYIKGKPAAAAKLAIAVDALGLNPTKFAKQNLVAAITKNLPSNGDVGGYPFSQALALIALDRTGATIPDSMVTRLLSQQNKDGSFGQNDPDSTALAIIALRAIADSKAEQSALSDAISWATDHQTGAGYWDNYSPVDSTGLMGSALAAVGSDSASAAARAWLTGVQLKDGGFANSLGGTRSNLMATSEALWLLSGTNLSTVSLKLAACGSTPPAMLSATTSCSGVWVVVDRGNGQVATRCATTYATGAAALASAGFSVKTFSTQFGPSICQIRSFPAGCDTTFGSGYWSYWTSTLDPATGTWSAWDYAQTGPASSHPVKGVAEAHLWIPSSIPWTASPAPTPSVKPPKAYTSAPRPTISGVTKVGKKLTVVTGTWSPKPDKFSYRWFRSGKPIAKATGKTYQLKKADKGKTIKVSITASGSGLQTAVRTSLSTPKVTK
ncbi:hypothetical protein ATK74_2100 [Propionicimonas paludicola]|uniref:Prenyltransferase/squalene oxidase-like repeat protein n=1 Tax=Propionicimonas paludicola TaxID=185243 RepID=A0A2A9CSV8_9ACTN|nr:terpene cyclase/mutase family protein [Propionicimonas paludicola]PFG17527.1 hypothetical protein ATK74_2100 [Propionicimonas paludicola]